MYIPMVCILTADVCILTDKRMFKPLVFYLIFVLHLLLFKVALSFPINKFHKQIF